LAIDEGDAQFFGLRRVDKHSFHAELVSGADPRPLPAKVVRRRIAFSLGQASSARGLWAGISSNNSLAGLKDPLRGFLGGRQGRRIVVEFFLLPRPGLSRCLKTFFPGYATGAYGRSRVVAQTAREDTNYPLWRPK
jgi:hypothetical protein